jgi:hypothetical protein
MVTSELGFSEEEMVSIRTIVSKFITSNIKFMISTTSQYMEGEFRKY